MNDSKIALDAQRPQSAVLWKRPNMYPMSYEGAYTKEQQRKNRESNRTNRANSLRDERTHLLCEIGGGWVKYFTACKNINPRNRAQVAAVVRVFAILAKNPWFLRLWEEVEQEIEERANGKNPTGPGES